MSQAIINGLYNIACRGVATGGTKTTLIDATKVFDADIFNDKILKISIGGIDYFKKITDTAESTLTFATLPGTPAKAVWTISTGITITVTSAADGGNEYTIESALAVGNNKPLEAALDGNVIRVTLATGAAGLSNDVANTVTLVTAAIDALAEFTAAAAGEGSTVVGETTTPIAFADGVEEVKPLENTTYEIAWR